MEHHTGTLQQYEETIRLEKEIPLILAQKTGRRAKILALKQLRNSVSTPLAQSRLDYCISRLKARRLQTLTHIFYALILIPYSIFILYRTYQIAHPEQYVFTNLFHLTAVQSVYILYFIPIAIFVFYLIIYIRRGKK